MHAQDLLKATARLASAQAREVAAALAATVSGLDAEQFPAACMQATDQLQAQHLDLLNGQHLAPLVACCVYGVAKCLDVAVSFRVRAHPCTVLCGGRRGPLLVCAMMHMSCGCGFPWDRV